MLAPHNLRKPFPHHFGPSFFLALSFAVTIGCAVGMHENTISNTLADWFVFASISTIIIRFIEAQTRPFALHKKNDDDDDDDVEEENQPSSFYSESEQNVVPNTTKPLCRSKHNNKHSYRIVDLLDRRSCYTVILIVLLGGILQTFFVIKLIVYFLQNYIIHLLNNGWRFIVESYLNSSCVAFIKGFFYGTYNLLNQSSETFDEAVNYVTNVFS